MLCLLLKYDIDNAEAPNYGLPRQICVVIFCREYYHAFSGVQALDFR